MLFGSISLRRSFHLHVPDYIKKLPRIDRFIKLYDPDLKYLTDRIRLFSDKKNIVLDVGANEGQSVDWVLANVKNPTIYAFEPTDSLVEKLISKYRSYQNVKVVPVALSDYIGEGQFYESEFTATNSLLQPDLKRYQSYNKSLADKFRCGTTRSVTVDTLDRWYRTNCDGEVIDLLKIDTQGNDFNVISGGQETIKEKVRAVVVELHYLKFYEGSKLFYNVLEASYGMGFFLVSFFENNKIGGTQLLENNALLLNRKFIEDDVLFH